MCLKIRNTVTNKQWVKENITMKNIKQYNLKSMKNIAYENVQDEVKVVLKRKIHIVEKIKAENIEQKVSARPKQTDKQKERENINNNSN